MNWFKPKTLIATVGAVVLPLLALLYLASKPGKGSVAAVLLQVGIVVVSLVLFATLLSRVLEQMNAGRVGRWLETPEGKEWLDSLPEDERETFQARFDEFK